MPFKNSRIEALNHVQTFLLIIERTCHVEGRKRYMISLKFLRNKNACPGLGATTSITQETNWHLTLFDGTAATVTEKPKREVICKPEMKVSRYCSSSYINWGGSESPTPTIVLPLQPPPNSISVHPADFWINCQFLNQWALAFELRQMEFAYYCGTSTTFSHQTPVVVVCILQTV
jgi:hypothetical protein